jgi:hypothetical protein
MPSSFELLQNPIIAYKKGEKINFTAFGVPYWQSLIKEILSDGTVEVEHTDRTTDSFAVQDMTLNYKIDQTIQAALAPSSNTAGSPGTAIEEAMILFTLNLPGADVHQSTNGGLVLSQRSGQYVGAVWVDSSTPSTVGGFGYGPGPQNQPPVQQPPSGVVNVPPVYYPASPTPPTESVSSGVANFTGYPSQPGYSGYPSQPSQPSQPSYPSYPSQPGQPGYPSQPGYPGYPTTPAYPSYGMPGYGSAAPSTVIFNNGGAPIYINVRAKHVIEAVTTTEFIK